MPNTLPDVCSPEAAKKIAPGTVDNVGTVANMREKWPYSNLNIGYSFTVPIAEITNEQSLRNMVTAKSKFLKKKFTVIKHGEPYNCFEIARIA